MEASYWPTEVLLTSLRFGGTAFHHFKLVWASVMHKWIEEFSELIFSLHCACMHGRFLNASFFHWPVSVLCMYVVML